jgi:DNA-binding response OmpR family regulator
MVDDDRDVLELFRKVLEVSGFLVTVACGGRDAARIHSQLARVDLLITDINMPDQSGIDLAEELSAKQPDLPVLFITGGSTFVETRIGSRRGLLRKPFAPSALLNSVDVMLHPV